MPTLLDTTTIVGGLGQQILDWSLGDDRIFEGDVSSLIPSPDSLTDCYFTLKTSPTLPDQDAVLQIHITTTPTNHGYIGPGISNRYGLINLHVFSGDYEGLVSVGPVYYWDFRVLTYKGATLTVASGTVQYVPNATQANKAGVPAVLPNNGQPRFRGFLPNAPWLLRNFSGSFIPGDYYRNANPSRGGPSGWVCIVACADASGFVEDGIGVGSAPPPIPNPFVGNLAGVINIMDAKYGAYCDAQDYFDCSGVINTTTVTFGTGGPPFTNADIGKTISLGATDQVLTILSLNNARSIEVSAPLSASFGPNQCVVGHDDTAAILAALSDVPTAVDYGHGTGVYIPGKSLVTTEIAVTTPGTFLFGRGIYISAIVGANTLSSSPHDCLLYWSTGNTGTPSGFHDLGVIYALGGSTHEAIKVANPLTVFIDNVWGGGTQLGATGKAAFHLLGNDDGTPGVDVRVRNCEFESANRGVCIENNMAFDFDHVSVYNVVDYGFLLLNAPTPGANYQSEHPSRFDGCDAWDCQVGGFYANGYKNIILDGFKAKNDGQNPYMGVGIDLFACDNISVIAPHVRHAYKKGIYIHGSSQRITLVSPHVFGVGDYTSVPADTLWGIDVSNNNAGPVDIFAPLINQSYGGGLHMAAYGSIHGGQIIDCALNNSSTQGLVSLLIEPGAFNFDKVYTYGTGLINNGGPRGTAVKITSGQNPGPSTIPFFGLQAVGGFSTVLDDADGAAIFFLCDAQNNVGSLGNIIGSTGNFAGQVQIANELDVTGVSKLANLFPTIRGLKNNPLAYSASITPDLTIGEWCSLSVTNGTGFTINDPTVPALVAGEVMEWTLLLANDSGGAMGVITLGAAFKGVPTPPANGKRRLSRWVFDGLFHNLLSESPTDI